MAQLTAKTLAALDAQVRQADQLHALEAEIDEPEPPMLDDTALLLEAEQSAARQAHLAALQREFDELAALTADDAVEWTTRRRDRAACALQSAWRKHVARTAFLRVVRQSLQQKRYHAAVLIQRAQRTHRRIAVEASAPISKDAVALLEKQIVQRTLQMAEELGNALQKQKAWQQALHVAESSGTALEGDEPKMPSWFDSPSWKQDADAQRGSALVYQLRDIAKSALYDGLLTSLPPQTHVLRAQQWAELRAKLQHTVVSRQVLRTRAASLHAQMFQPPPLPPASKFRDMDLRSDAMDLISPLAGLTPSVQAAHRRALAQARLAVEMEEGHKLEDSVEGSTVVVNDAALQKVQEDLSSLGHASENLSSAELLWLASLSQAQKL